MQSIKLIYFWIACILQQRIKPAAIVFTIVIGFLFFCGCSNKTATEVEPPPFDWPVYKDFDPSWSPDGTIIAYVQNDISVPPVGIYFINPDGTNKRLFLESIEFTTLWRKPDWSPDGKWLVLCETYSAQIYKIRVPEGDSLTQLTTMGRNFFPAWNPDGKKIAWDTNYMDSLGANVIWIMDADGSNKKNICQQGVGERRMPDWNPITNKIVHMRYGDDDGTVWRGIAEMDTNGENVRHIFEISLTGSYPKVSPDGTKIVFSSQAEGQGPRVWVVNSDGNNPIKLTETGGDHPAWSPDGNGIVYCNTGVDGRLWIMNADGSNKRKLTP
ncbi:PD40 domain-containing protein [candidate division TA06 bacterium]|nr:PD40 domain-containing protein [candidate division TA06 bacterium]